MKCLNCESETSNPKFCSVSCSTTYNNKKYPKRKAKNICMDCGTKVSNRETKRCFSCHLKYNKRKPRSEQKKYLCKTCGASVGKKTTLCRSCKKVVRKNKYISRWLGGLETGNKGINYICLHNYVREYMIEESGGACPRCGWCEVNQITGNVPLEINHIDGNILNSSPENLEVLCPNCHSLTNNYRALNKNSKRKRN